MILRKILVPVDLSPRSTGAARYAISLAQQLDSELVFVHAAKEGRMPGNTADAVLELITEICNGIPNKFLRREGSPVPVILNAAQSEEPDLILMPTKGHSALSRLVERSITAQVQRAAPCPVWAGVNDLSLRAGKPIQSILCGLSLGPHAGTVLRWSADLAARLAAALTVVHTSKTLDSIPGYPTNGEWRLWVRKMARDDIRALQMSAGTHADVWLESGRPSEAISSVAEHLRADLVVVGKSPPRRFLSGLRTLSYDLLCRAPCPVAAV
ncbi:MAG: universal stress protein [Bryobacterales bacterium]|nr:universal stress protein [Bryobacterales bacterium]